MHQETLRARPRATFNMIASFLGTTRPFHARHNFAVYNAHPGERSGLCRNASLVLRLQRALEGQYRAIDEALKMAGTVLPRELLYRTRCDRPEVLAAEPTPNWAYKR